MKFYADAQGRMLRRIALDILVVLWTALAVWLGFQVHSQILRLQAIGSSIADIGRTFNAWIGDFTNSIPGQGLPLIGSALSDYARGLATSLQGQSGDVLITHGNQLNDVIGSLSLYFGIATTVLALLLITVPYTSVRIVGAREMGAGRAFVESARTGGRVHEAEALLAFRALATLRFVQIMRVSDDPVGELTSGTYAALADAMLGRMGLDPSRLRGNVPGPAPLTGTGKSLT